MIDPEQYRKLIAQLGPLRDRIIAILSADAELLAEATLAALHRIIRDNPDTDLTELADIIDRDLRLPASARDRLTKHLHEGQARMARLRAQMHGSITDAVLSLEPVALQARAAVDFPAIRHGLNRTVQRALQHVIDTGGEITDVTRRLQRLRVVGHRARTLANTALAQYDNAANVLLARQGGITRYKYHGPPAEREFCQALLSTGRFYTLAEINAMDNGQGLPVWSSCGGYNCRHQWLPVPVRDEVSEEWFNRDVQTLIDVDASTQKRIFGRELERSEFIRLAGAPDGAKLLVEPAGNAIELVVEHPLYSDQCVRRIYKAGNGDVRMVNEGLFTKKESPGAFGLRAFQQQVQQCSELGIRKIRTTAARDRDLNGYYTWPRFGYDAELPVKFRSLLPPELSDVDNLSDLMKTKQGRDWWTLNGDTVTVDFDLAPDSYSMRTLREYSLSRKVYPWP
ncbi:MAG: hypothetical protein M5R41_10500 [Bacteroidia bacterium]|nr:hypothetical protein [Bacteroidia bacterium]